MKRLIIIAILSKSHLLFGQTYIVDFCTTTSLSVSVSPILGSYRWNLPTGWVSSGGNSSVGTFTNSITIKPTQCAISGTISVIEVILNPDLSTTITTVNVSLVAAVPIVSVSPPSGYTGSTFGNSIPVTFTANLTPSMGCAQSYSWNYPSGWTFQSQSGNSVTLIPGGTSSDAGAIYVSVNFSCGTSIQSGNYNAAYTAPVIVGPSQVCTSSSFSIANTGPGVSVQWSSGNANALTVSSQANGTFAAVSGYTGTGVISATLYFGANQTSPAAKTVYVGAPAADISTLIYASGNRGVNPISLSPSSTYLFICDQVPGADSYNWVVTKGFSLFGGNGASSEYINTPATTGSYTLFCSVSNTCGSRYTNSLGINLGSGGGGGGGKLGPPPAIAVAAFPNPTSSTLIVHITDSTSTQDGEDRFTQPYELQLMDRYSGKVFSTQSNKKTIDIPVGNLPKGIYYLNVSYKEVVLRKQIVIER